MKTFTGTIDKNTKIAVLYGGLSSERDVSLRSGKNCYDALIRLGYNKTILIDVDKNISKNLIDKNIQIAYLALHGAYGEDGCIQGLLEIMGIPYTGSKVQSSAIGMSKSISKIIFKEHNINMPKSIVIKDYSNDLDISNSFEFSNLSFPVMVKPSTEGSSIGMSKSETMESLISDINEAQKYCKEVLVEEFIEGKTLTVGVLDIQTKTIATPVLELRSKNGWYDFESKYTQGLTEFILPAEIDEQSAKSIQEDAIKAHKALDCRGMSRIDFILTDNKISYILEANTLPGMTNLSDLPAQAKAIDISYDTLVDIILHSSLL